MNRDEYSALDGLGLADLVIRREVTPRELLECAWAAVETENPTLNAVVDLFRDEAEGALARGLPEGPFQGVPFLLKDLGAMCTGTRTTLGSRLFRDFIPDHDSELVARQRRAGLVVFGKTNLPELGLSFTTEPALFGPARNPWDLERSPGGSSGGAAVAVAARWVPIAHGSDGAGSLRVPASCCGLFGFKPSRGLTPTGPDAGESLFGLGIDHALSRSVRDSAALLDATRGEDLGPPYAAPRPERPFLDEVQSPPRPLRIAMVDQAPGDATLHSDCRAAVARAATLCAELGHIVEPATWPPEWRMEAVISGLLGAFVSHLLHRVCPALGLVPDPDAIEPSTLAFAARGRSMSSDDLAAALARRDAIARSVGRFLARFDVVLTPTLATPPPELGALGLDVPGASAEELVDRLFAFAPFTAVFNAAGAPAMNVPLHWSAAGLPIGVQFAARLGSDATLFRLAGQLERASPWASRLPPQLTR